MFPDLEGAKWKKKKPKTFSFSPSGRREERGGSHVQEDLSGSTLSTIVQSLAPLVLWGAHTLVLGISWFSC